jgi:glycerol-3-phosphate dehydrogenase (NAD(P)+)
MTAQRVLIIGAGDFGSTLHQLVSQNGHIARMYCPVCDETHSTTADLEQALNKVDLVILAVPMSVIREVFVPLFEYMERSTPILSVTKGIDLESGQLVSEIFESQGGDLNNFAQLSGPNFSREIREGIPTATVVASNNDELVHLVTTILGNENFRIYASRDIIGVEVAGAIKNILAIASGIHDGLGLGANSRAALITRGLAEFVRYATWRGAHKSTLMGLSGVGDVILSSTSDQSRNYRFGKMIGEGMPVGEARKKIASTIEGIGTTEAVYSSIDKFAGEMPITETVYKIIFEDMPSKEAVAHLMTRPWGYEG